MTCDQGEQEALALISPLVSYNVIYVLQPGQLVNKCNLRIRFEFVITTRLILLKVELFQTFYFQKQRFAIFVTGPTPMIPGYKQMSQLGPRDI